MHVIECSEKLATGLEHVVYISDDRRRIIKAPSFLGKTWHIMDPGLAERDIVMLEEYEIPHVPTEIIIPTERERITILLQGAIAQETSYVMQQPFIEDAEILDFMHLQNPSILQSVTDMIEKSEDMLDDVQLGIDLVGGKSFIELFRAFFKWRVQAKMHNLLLPNRDYYDERGNIIAPAGQPTLCDTRLYNCSDEIHNPAAVMRRNIQHFQHEIMHAFLGKLAPDAPHRPIQLRTAFHRAIAFLLRSFVEFRLEKP